MVSIGATILSQVATNIANGRIPRVAAGLAVSYALMSNGINWVATSRFTRQNLLTGERRRVHRAVRRGDLPNETPVLLRPLVNRIEHHVRPRPFVPLVRDGVLLPRTATGVGRRQVRVGNDQVARTIPVSLNPTTIPTPSDQPVIERSVWVEPSLLGHLKLYALFRKRTHELKLVLKAKAMAYTVDWSDSAVVRYEQIAAAVAIAMVPGPEELEALAHLESPSAAQAINTVNSVFDQHRGWFSGRRDEMVEIVRSQLTPLQHLRGWFHDQLFSRPTGSVPSN